MDSQCAAVVVDTCMYVGICNAQKAATVSLHPPCTGRSYTYIYLHVHKNAHYHTYMYTLYNDFQADFVLIYF